MEEENIQEEIWENPEVSNNSNDEEDHTKGDPISNRETFVSEIFETSDRLERLKHRWRGDIEEKGIWKQKFEPLASDAFINKQISAAEAVIDKINSFTKKNDKETRRILHDSVKSFILDAVDEESVKVQHIRTMSKTYEHSLELFLGLVEFGHGSVVLSNSLAGLGLKQNENNNKNGGMLEWLKGKTNQ